MSGLFNEMIMQIVYYAVIMGLTLFSVGFLQKGFFWKFLKVKMSFGTLVLIKSRELPQDKWFYGEIESGMLKFKVGDGSKTLAIPEDVPVFYRIMGCNTIDINGKYNSICTTNYKAVTGFDALKYDDMHKRALYRPVEEDKFKKIIIALLVVVFIAIVVVIYIQNALVIPKMDLLSILVDKSSQGFVIGGGAI